MVGQSYTCHLRATHGSNTSISVAMFRLLGMAKPEDEARKLMDSLRRDNVPFNKGAGYRLVR
jgi:hypothetical protein